MEKKNLVKLALTAFAVAASAPAAVQADVHTAPTLLARASCGGGSCGGARQRQVSYNDPYNARYYQADNYNYSTPNSNRAYGAPSGSYEVNAGPGFSSSYDRSGSDFNSSRGYNQGGYGETYRTYTTDSESQSTNRSFNTSNDFDRPGTATVTITEIELVRQLSPQAKAIYQSLDSEGKVLARQLAGQESFRDKDLAVKEAQRRINDKRGMSNSTSSYNTNSGMNR